MRMLMYTVVVVGVASCQGNQVCHIDSYCSSSSWQQKRVNGL